MPETPLRSADSTSWAIRAGVHVVHQVVVELVRRPGRAPRRSGPGRWAAGRPGAAAAGRASARTRPARRPPRRPRRRAGPPGARRSAAGAARRSECRCPCSRSRTTGSAWPQYGHSKSPYSTTVTDASAGPRMWSRSGSTAGIRSSICCAVAEQRAGPSRRREQGGDPEDRPGQRRTATTTADSAPSLASASCSPWKARGRDQERDGEADAGDRAAAESPRPSRPGGRIRPRVSRVTSHDVADHGRSACRRRSRRGCRA